MNPTQPIPPSDPNVPPAPRGCLGTGGAVGALFLSGVYLLNFSMGILELPDNLPIIGNLDELTASWIFFSALAYLGVDVLPFLRRKQGQ